MWSQNLIWFFNYHIWSHWKKSYQNQWIENQHCNLKIYQYHFNNPISIVFWTYFELNNINRFSRGCKHLEHLTLKLFISMKYLCHVILFSLHKWCIDMTISQAQEINDSFLINYVTSAFYVKNLHVDADK